MLIYVIIHNPLVLRKTILAKTPAQCPRVPAHFSGFPFILFRSTQRRANMLKDQGTRTKKGDARSTFTSINIHTIILGFFVAIFFTCRKDTRTT
jgi:hypothetical protein